MGWFNIVHLKSFPTLVSAPDVQREISRFVDRYIQPSVHVALPSGVHVIDFHAASHPTCHIPERVL